MRIPRLRISLLAAAAVVGATAAVAIAAPTHARDNASDLQHALAKTAKISSAHFSFTLGISGGAASQTGAISIGGTGGFDTKHQTSTITVDLGPLAAALGQLGGGKGTIPQKVDIVVLKNLVYVHIPALAVQAGGAGKEWLKIDVNKLPKSKTGGLDASQATKTSPTKALAALKGSVSVHKSGTAKVRGSSTTRYRVLVNATKVVKALVPKAQQAAQLKSLKTAGISTVPADIYVDGSGYVRRFQVALKNVKSQGSPPTSITVSFDIYDVGTSVHASAPPASKTADGNALIAGLLGSLGGSGGGG
jgi:hypothetical protein